jgi:hypothetical protein
MKPVLTTSPLDLGKLQRAFSDARAGLRLAEGALKRAQDSRDAARVKAGAAEQALRDATRAVLG